MKWVKLFEDWYINESLPSSIMSDIALFGNKEPDDKKVEDEINKTLGDNAKITIENKPVSELSIENKKLQDKIKSSIDTDSVVLINVKTPDNPSPYTFIIPKQKDKGITFDKSGTALLPTIFVGKNDAININIGGLRSILNDVAKGNDFDIDRATAKISLKHNI